MDVSTNCLEDDVVEEERELAAFELIELNLFDFDPCFDAINEPTQNLYPKLT